MSITQAYNSWRWAWQHDRRKHEIEPTDDNAWEEYINSLPISEVIWNLTVFEDEENV